MNDPVRGRIVGCAGDDFRAVMIVGEDVEIGTGNKVEAGALIERQDLEIAAGIESRAVAVSRFA
jgi:hypothetical protein